MIKENTYCSQICSYDSTHISGTRVGATPRRIAGQEQTMWVLCEDHIVERIHGLLHLVVGIQLIAFWRHHASDFLVELLPVLLTQHSTNLFILVLIQVRRAKIRDAVAVVTGGWSQLSATITNHVNEHSLDYLFTSAFNSCSCHLVYESRLITGRCN